MVDNVLSGSSHSVKSPLALGLFIIYIAGFHVMGVRMGYGVFGVQDRSYGYLSTPKPPKAVVIPSSIS